ncbi:MAG: S9 family peptidase [Rubrivivax sp.]|nr:S9 family peptidase [Rubrivivax sp.]
MKTSAIAALATGMLAFQVMAQTPTPPVAQRIPYTVKSPHGDRVDEYYWLRDDDPKAKRPEVMAYLQAENAHTAAVMAPLAGLQQTLVAEMKARIQPDESTPPAYESGWWTWTEFAPGEDYPRYFRQRGTPERPDAKAPRELMLDVPALAKGHAFYRVGEKALSPDGRILAWAEDTNGRRIHTLRFRDLAAGRDLPDRVTGALEDIVWAADNRTLFYVKQDPVTLQSGPVYRHVLGTDASQDVKVYEEADKTLFVELKPSASRRFVIIFMRGGDMSETRAVRADRPDSPVQTILARQSGIRHGADHIGKRWIFRTAEGAPNFRLVSAPEGATEVRSAWRTLVPGRDDATLEGFALFDGAIALQERVDGERRLRLLVNGRSKPVATPAGTTVTLAAAPDARAAHVRFGLGSLVMPQATWDLHLKSGERILRKQRQVPGFDPARYATERLWAPARDGKRVPVTLAWRRDKARPDGSAPLLVYGYGAYGASSDPFFNPNRVSLLDRGFVYAIAHVRGGADLGEAWFEDGRKFNKKNSFNDFVDATDALVKAGWGAKDRVFAAGGSAGGLLMGAVANQAPERYRGMLVAVPFVDVVTTMLDESIPLTTNEYSQWGDPRQKAAYDYMLSYSPYDQLRAQAYPAMYVSTGLWDSQVQYYEPAKYVARLRALKTDRNPLLLDVDMSSGHGGASGRFSVLERTAREYAFLIDLAGLR